MSSFNPADLELTGGLFIGLYFLDKAFSRWHPVQAARAWLEDRREAADYSEWDRQAVRPVRPQGDMHAAIDPPAFRIRRRERQYIRTGEPTQAEVYGNAVREQAMYSALAPENILRDTQEVITETFQAITGELPAVRSGPPALESQPVDFEKEADDFIASMKARNEAWLEEHIGKETLAEIRAERAAKEAATQQAVESWV